MARFQHPNAYAPTGLQLLPLRFERLGPDRYIVNNLVGEFLPLSRQELHRLVALDLMPNDGLYEKALKSCLLPPRATKHHRSYWRCVCEPGWHSYRNPQPFISSSSLFDASIPVHTAKYHVEASTGNALI